MVNPMFLYRHRHKKQMRFVNGIPRINQGENMTHATPNSIETSLAAWLPSRDYAYSLVSGLVTFLLAFGLVNAVESALWIQLGVASVAFVYALAFSPHAWRTALYAVVGPAGGVLMAYGLVQDVRWAIITAGVGQILGLSTAAVAAGRPIAGQSSAVSGLLTVPQKLQRA